MKQKAFRICLVIPTLGPGGMERVMAELARYFDEKELTEIHIVLYGRNREIFYELTKNIKIHKPEFTFKSNKRWYYALKTLLFLRKKITSISPDVILSFGEDWNNLVLLSQIGLGFPIYVADRAEPGRSRSPLQELLRRFLYPYAHGIVVQTDIAKKIYQKKFDSKKIKVIGNPIRNIGQNGKIENREKIILSVGRLVDTKNFDQLIRIFARINSPDWKLVIIGGDSQRQNISEQLNELIVKLDLKQKVLLTGTVSNVDEYYLKSKIFAFTSISEGFPNVIGEAMSAGLPVISYNCIAGPSEMISDGKTGFLISIDDISCFKEKLELLMNDPELRQQMGENGKEKIKEYTIENIGEKYYSLLRFNQ